MSIVWSPSEALRLSLVPYFRNVADTMVITGTGIDALRLHFDSFRKDLMDGELEQLRRLSRFKRAFGIVSNSSSGKDGIIPLLQDLFPDESKRDSVRNLVEWCPPVVEDGLPQKVCSLASMGCSDDEFKRKVDCARIALEVDFGEKVRRMRTIVEIVAAFPYAFPDKTQQAAAGQIISDFHKKYPQYIETTARHLAGVCAKPHASDAFEEFKAAMAYSSSRDGAL